MNDLLSEILPESMIDLMKSIFEKFIRPDSIYELNLTGNILPRIRKKFKGGVLDENIFEEVVSEVLRLLYQNTFKTFIKSKGLEN